MKTIYAVISMHRSGSSLFMYFLKKNGINIGKVLKKEYSKSNILGHLENIEILDINKKIYKENNLNWFDIFFKDLKINNSIQKKLESIFNKNLENQKLFVFKDPRTLFLINQYKSFLKKKFNIKTILILRKPEDIILSIHKRDGFPIYLIYYFYLFSLSKILKFYEGGGIIKIFYDDFYKKKIINNKMSNIFNKKININSDVLLKKNFNKKNNILNLEERKFLDEIYKELKNKEIKDFSKNIKRKIEKTLLDNKFLKKDFDIINKTSLNLANERKRSLYFKKLSQENLKRLTDENKRALYFKKLSQENLERLTDENKRALYFKKLSQENLERLANEKKRALYFKKLNQKNLERLANEKKRSIQF